MSDSDPKSFAELGLPDVVLKSLSRLGYETPSPIQAECIPLLLQGRDIIGQAQTGTGKTAAFALPLLSRVELSLAKPQVLVLAPTRELAIQVAEAFQSYASGIRGFHVLPVYGGQAYDIQLRQLKRGVHVIVGTPGRVMDHIERKTLQLDQLQALVLDEADEMLRMGFIEDVEWILERTPTQRQIALFSATMPAAIQKVAKNYLQQPQHIQIKSKTRTATTINQGFLQVKGYKKMDALTRVLESIEFDAVLIFVRTKNATVELAEKLEARGYTSAALNGDIAQKMRERTIERLKQKKIDLVIATDVAARGLDVERISHVINYDIPYDAESYVHRIGRTGRAGRSGEAILFVTPKERHLLRSIEKMTQHKIGPLQLPSTEEINQQRVERFKQRIQDTIDGQDLTQCRHVVQSYMQQHDSDPLLVAAALVRMVQGEEPLLLADMPERKQTARASGKDQGGSTKSAGQGRTEKKVDYRARPLKEFPEIAMRRYRLDVGYQHDAMPGNIVGAIANEAEIDSCYIGNIDIHDDFSLIDLPDGMPREVFKILKKTRVSGRPLNIRAARPDSGENDEPRPKKRKSNKPKHNKRKGKRPAVARRKLQSKR